MPVTGERISVPGCTTMSAAVVAPVPRSRVSMTDGDTALASGCRAWAPSWFDSWNPIRSTWDDGCTSDIPPTAANGTPQPWSATDRAGAADGAVVGEEVVTAATVAGGAVAGGALVVTGAGGSVVVVAGARVELVVV